MLAWGERCRLIDICRFRKDCLWTKGLSFDKYCKWMQEPYKYMVYDEFHKKWKMAEADVIRSIKVEEKRKSPRKREYKLIKYYRYPKKLNSENIDYICDSHKNSIVRHEDLASMFSLSVQTIGTIIKNGREKQPEIY